MLQDEFHNDFYSDNREFLRTYKEKALEFLPEKPCRVLDVGCGTGVNSERIIQLGHKVVGIDISETAINKYKELGFEGYVHNINSPLPASWNESFDVVWAADVLEHLESPQAAIRSIYKVLKNQGILIATTINSSWFVFRILYLLGKTVTQLQHPHHIKFFNVELIREYIEEGGGEVANIIGRNNILIFPENKKLQWLIKTFNFIGFKFNKEWSIKHSKYYYHLSYFSRFGISFLADNLIVIAQKK